ncbi:hypothetical protein [Streptomyces sp. JNUCC 63]
MAENPGKRENTGKDERPPKTALGEVLHEFENAETDVDDTRERRHRGEAGEAITPNTRAQEEEESEGD